MSDNISELFYNKLIIDIFNFGVLYIFIFLSLYMLITIVIDRIITKPHVFRLNSETIYSVLKIFSEFLYLLSVSFSVVIILFLLKGVLGSTNDVGLLVIKNANWFTVSGAFILIFISVPIRIFVTEKSILMNIVDILIILIVNILMLLGMVVGSLTYFNYLIN